MSAEKNTVVGQAQAQMIAAVCGNILIFCGLLVAGTFTLLASDAVPRSSPLFMSAVAVTFLAGFVSGLLALGAIMNAHNLARRAEKVQAGTDGDETRVISARTWATRLSDWSFMSAILATLGASVTVSLLLAQLWGNSDTVPKVEISPVEGGVALEMRGEPVPTVKILRDADGCKGVLSLKDAEVLISRLCQ
jgi:hypothetical protein